MREQKSIVKRDACIKFYDVARPLEIDASRIDLEPHYYRKQMA